MKYKRDYWVKAKAENAHFLVELAKSIDAAQDYLNAAWINGYRPYRIISITLGGIVIIVESDTNNGSSNAS